MLCYRNFLVAKKFMEKEGEESIEIFRRNFLSQSAETFRRGTLYSFIHFGYRINLCFRGLCHDFPLKFFCLSVPKRFVEEPISAVFQKICGSEKVHEKDGGGGSIEVFRRDTFVLKCRENS